MKLATTQPLTLSQIAQQYGYALRTLEALNPKVAPGQKISSFVAPSSFGRASLSDAAKQAHAVKERTDRDAGLGAHPSSPAAGGMLRIRLEKEMKVMQDFQLAGRDLLRQHTVSPPGMSLDAAVGLLEAPGVSSDRTRRRDAALAFMKYQFTPLDPDAVHFDRDYDAAFAAAVVVLQNADPAHKRQFVDEILFNVAHPANHGVLWPLVCDLLRPDELAQELLSRLRSDNELHVHNALRLPYFVYGRRSDYELSDASRTALQSAAQALGQRPVLNPLVRDAVTEFALPVNV